MPIESKLLVTALASGLAAGLAASALWATLSPPAEERPAAVAPQGPRTDPELIERLARLERVQSELEMRLRSSEQRRQEVLWEVEAGLAGLEPTGSQATPEVTRAAERLGTGPEARELVLDVLASERARQEEERREQAAERMADMRLNRALRIAERFELDAQDRDALVALVEEEFERGSHVFEALMSAGRDTAARRAALDEWDELREWTQVQIGVRFAPDVAERIAAELRNPLGGMRGGRANAPRAGARGGRPQAGQ